jgi:hypothetical protein
MGAEYLVLAGFLPPELPAFTDYAIPAHDLYHKVNIRKTLHHVLDLLSVKSQVIT